MLIRWFNNLEYSIIKNSTGEIVRQYNHARIITANQDKIIKKHYENTEFKSVQEEYSGQFIMFIYSNLNKLSKVLKNEDITKLMFIATYTDYKGALKYENGRVITKKDLIKLLKINNKSFYEFMNKLINTKIIIEENDKFIVNNEYFIKGKLKKDVKFIKLYINAIRSIYKNTTIRQHKQLSSIFLLIPYVNIKFSVICFNPLETEQDKVKIMTIKDIAKALNYSKVQTIKEFMFKLKIENHSVFATFKDNNKECIVVNPKIMFIGEDLKNYRSLINLFEIN
jgi:uncharacterized protein YegP (UPF0339 family)